MLSGDWRAAVTCTAGFKSPRVVEGTLQELADEGGGLSGTGEYLAGIGKEAPGQKERV